MKTFFWHSSNWQAKPEGFCFGGNKSYSGFLLFLLFVLFLFSCTDSDTHEKTDYIGAAKQFLLDENYDKTIETLNKVKKDQQKKKYHLLRGLALFKLGAFKKSITSFEKALPESLELNTYISYLCLMSGNLKKANEIANVLLEKFGNKPNIFFLKGNIEFKKNNLSEAREYFNKAITIEKAFTKAFIGIGNTYFIERQFVRAEQNYLKAVFLSDNDIRPYIALARFYRAMRRYPDAENNLKTALKMQPDSKVTLMALLSLRIETKDYANALTLLDKALKLYPVSLGLKIKKAKIYFYLNKLDESFEVIQRIVASFKENTQIALLLGEYYLRKNDLTLATYNFNKAMKASPYSFEVNYFLGLVNIIDNNIRSSKRYLEESIDQYPGYTPSHLLLANINLLQKQYDLAGKHARLVILLEPNNVSAHIINGVSLLFLGYKKEAQYEFDVVKHFNPGNPIGDLIFSQMEPIKPGQWSSGISTTQINRKFAEWFFLELELIKTLNLDKKHIEQRVAPYIKGTSNFTSFLLLGGFYKKRGDLNEAAGYFEKAMKIDEGNVLPYYYLASIKNLQGDKKSAISLLQKAVELDKLFLKSYRALGGLYETVNDYDNAKKTFETALQYFPEDTLVLNNLAWINLVYFKDKTSSYSYIHNAMALSPNDPDLIDTMAWWYFHNNKYDQAMNLLRGIVASHPENSEYQYHLGRVLLDNNKKVTGKALLEKIMKNTTDLSRKNEIKEILFL